MGVTSFAGVASSRLGGFADLSGRRLFRHGHSTISQADCYQIQPLLFKTGHYRKASDLLHLLSDLRRVVVTANPSEVDGFVEVIDKADPRWIDAVVGRISR